MRLKKSKQGFFAAKNRKHLLKLKYPEQVAEPESPITVRIFLFDAVSFKKRYLPTAPCFVLMIFIYISSNSIQHEFFIYLI